MSDGRLKVKNEPIVRDTQSGALVFTNRTEIEEYNRKKQKNKLKEESYKTEINNLKTEIAEIKVLLSQLIADKHEKDK
jgi:hypothetical protein